jgi:hypothetical protein
MLFLRNIVNGTMNIGEGAGSAEGNSLGIAIKAAVIMVSTLPIIILYSLLQRFFITGLTVGSVKGYNIQPYALRFAELFSRSARSFTKGTEGNGGIPLRRRPCFWG